jgi:hypothetical protein
MRLHSSRLRSLLGLALMISAYQTAAAATCKTLSDPSNTLIKSIASWPEVDASMIPVDDAFPKVDAAFPWLATCAAAINPQSVLVSLGISQSTKNCLSTLEEADMDLSSADGWSESCTTLEKTVIPCIKSALTESIMDAFNSANGCCVDFLAMIKTLFGDSLEDMVDKVLKLAANAACSERSFTNLGGAKAKELCGYSIINSFSVIGSSKDALTDILAMLQVPSDQMCNAFAGRTFTNTKGGQTTIGFGTDSVDTMGVCLQPVDALLQYVASWPVWSATLNADGTSIALSDLFAAGKSLRGNLLISYATTKGNMPMMMLGAIDVLLGGMGDDSSDSVATDGFLEMTKAINSFATALVLHIPNTGGCTYPAQSITEVYDTSAITTATSSASTIAAAGVALLLSSLLVALL